MSGGATGTAANSGPDHRTVSGNTHGPGRISHCPSGRTPPHGPYSIRFGQLSCTAGLGRSCEPTTIRAQQFQAPSRGQRRRSVVPALLASRDSAHRENHRIESLRSGRFPVLGMSSRVLLVPWGRQPSRARRCVLPPARSRKPHPCTRTKKNGRDRFPFHHQSISHWGACGKAPVMPHNRPPSLRRGGPPACVGSTPRPRRKLAAFGGM